MASSQTKCLTSTLTLTLNVPGLVLRGVCHSSQGNFLLWSWERMSIQSTKMMSVGELYISIAVELRPLLHKQVEQNAKEPLRALDNNKRAIQLF